MPRRYQPPAKRRKRKNSQPNLPASAISPVESEEVCESETVPLARSPRPAVATTTGSGRHVIRDYAYVLGEFRRIVIVMAFIFIGIVIATAVLRWS